MIPIRIASGIASPARIASHRPSIGSQSRIIKKTAIWSPVAGPLASPSPTFFFFCTHDRPLLLFPHPSHSSSNPIRLLTVTCTHFCSCTYRGMIIIIIIILYYVMMICLDTCMHACMHMVCNASLSHIAYRHLYVLLHFLGMNRFSPHFLLFLLHLLFFSRR